MITDFVVYLDLDGVFADYDAGIQARGFKIDPSLKHELNRSGSKNPLKRQMYEAIQGTDFYRGLPILAGADLLWSRVQKYKPFFLTAAPKFGGTEDDYFLNPYWLGAAYHKRTWVEETLLVSLEPISYTDEEGFEWLMPQGRIEIEDERFICTTSARKHEFMHRRHGRHQVLIDDREANCIAWAEAGGFAIHYINAEDAVEAFDWYEQEGDLLRSGFPLSQPVGIVWSLEMERHKSLKINIYNVRNAV